ncbi:MAG TPA: hypothetical protein VNG71_21800 [Pyrinomonadaceae bacterium]|nr:hypothetical protein [Pyrinomonadaceae bacterium]
MACITKNLRICFLCMMVVSCLVLAFMSAARTGDYVASVQRAFAAGEIAEKKDG